ncbi:MAG: hypothetical protein NC102_03095 [Clostridium sp.]|nr:hypothetical protein [Clostridium sp.]
MRGNIVDWHGNTEWAYWKNMMGLLEPAFPSFRENEKADCVFTNATFFNTPKTKDVFERLYDKTRPFTLKLIAILSPEIAVCLSPNNFQRMKRTLKCDFQFLEVFGSRLTIGIYNNSVFVNTYHPASYYSSAYKDLVRKSLKIIRENLTANLSKIFDLLRSSLQNEWNEMNAMPALESQIKNSKI